MGRRLAWLVAGGLVAAFALPAIASAHVGRTLPVATNFTARIVSPVPDVRAQVVDGDQTLWLGAPATAVVRVPGTLGEPLLRFDARGVWLNLRSPTAQADRIDRYDLRPSPRPNARPLWHRVTAGHAYAWHEHRLHALEPLARKAGAVGPWAIPVVVDGRRRVLAGVLDFHPAGRTWAWIAATVAATLAGTAAAVLRRRALLVAALAALPLAAALRAGRELYGRPNVPVTGYVGVGITSAVGLALLAGLSSSQTRVPAAFLVGFGALYEGLTMLPLLTHALALNAVPSTAARVFEVVAVACGIAALGGSVLGNLRETQ
ncbi:MAG TPA: hypothetical protein VKR23_08530 [Gaiellaceae bacterium]|nr:hypothetical protein [Gaiellaceae bacterium]